jgi:hypothetical protein
MKPSESEGTSADTLAEFAAYIRKAEETVEQQGPRSFASLLFASLEGEQAAAAKIVASFNGFNWKEWEAKPCEPTEPPPLSTLSPP